MKNFNFQKAFISIAIICFLSLLIPFALYFSKASLAKLSSDAASDLSSAGEPQNREEDSQNKPMLAVWLASVYNLDYPSKQSMSESEMRSEASDICSRVSEMGLNTVFLQVRPFSDSLYRSEVFPWSAVITGIQGSDPGFDLLEIFTEAANEYDISVHAWINPYRITKGTQEKPNTDISKLSENHPARLHPEWTVEYGGALYFNPALSEVRDLIVSGALELTKYDIDGIHMDDYFYPYPIYSDGELLEFDDSEQFALSNDGLSLGDWRRSCVNQLVERLYTSIKIVNPSLKFGISPFGIWENDDGTNGGSPTSAGTQGYSDLYADTLAWINGGYIDYICPQIYWSFEYDDAPFDDVFDWWQSVTKDTHIDLIAGIAAYHIPDVSIAGWDDSEQLSRQLTYIMDSGNASGAAFYGYSQLINDDTGAAELCMSKVSEWKEIRAQDIYADE